MAAETDRSEHNLAVFFDFENLALGFQGRRDRFDVTRVIKRLVDKGKIVAKKAYADWNRYSSYTIALHEAAIELIEIPHRNQSGKNSADIHLCVDAMDLAYSKEHIDTFVIVSGDSDFSPLVSKLKELGKHTIGLGMQGSTSELLRDNCDEFIYYEDLGDDIGEWKEIDTALPEGKRKAFALLMDSCLALRRENKQNMMSSVIKDTMKRKKPSFNETYHGYRTFSALLEDAAKNGLIELETNPRSGTYMVTRFGEELKQVRQQRLPRAADDEATGERRPPRGRTGGQARLPRRDDAAPPRRRAPEAPPAAGPRLPPERPLRTLPIDLGDEADQPVRNRFPARRALPAPASEPEVREPLQREPLPREPLQRETQPREPLNRETQGREAPVREPQRREPLPPRPAPARRQPLPPPEDEQPRRPRRPEAPPVAAAPPSDLPPAPPERMVRRRPAPPPPPAEGPAPERQPERAPRRPLRDEAPAPEPVHVPEPRPAPAEAPRPSFGSGIFD